MSNTHTRQLLLTLILSQPLMTAVCLITSICAAGTGSSIERAPVVYLPFDGDFRDHGCPSHKPWLIEASVGWPYGSTNVIVKPVKLTAAECTVPPLVWWHVAVVTDPSAAQTLLYVNGEVVARSKETPAPAHKFVNPLRIGTWHEANQAFRGWVDEVKVYDYPRSAGQIKASGTVPR